MIPTVHARSIIADVSSVTTTLLNALTRRDLTEDVYLTGLIARLTNNNTKLTQANMEMSAHSLLPSIDKKRGEYVQAVFYEVKAKRRWPDDSVREAAEQVYKVIEKYGLHTINKSYAEESANINALLCDLEEEEIKAAVTSLNGFAGLLNQLEMTQKEFEAAYLQEVKQKVDADKNRSATELSLELRSQLNKELVTYVNTMARVRPVEYQGVAEELAVIIEDSNRRVRSRLKKAIEPEVTGKSNVSEKN
ncbi:MAG: hypothetical protein JEZ14_24775 [Marinilabiliaceae bacterium]|nr:hypothetical protein [Marinilabiliaceae bacterium]